MKNPKTINKFKNRIHGTFRKTKVNFAFVTRHPLTSQYSSSGVNESLNDLYLDLKSTQNSQKLTPDEEKLSLVFRNVEFL